MDVSTVATSTTNMTLQDNMTYLSEAHYYPLIKQPVYMVTILTLAYGTVFILAVLGNVSVIAVIYRDRRFHTVTYALLANLAVADVMVAVFCLPITLMTNLFNDWRFGAFLCKLVPYLQGVSVCASVNTLAAIAIDRYIAICHVLEFKLTMRSARVLVAVIWIMAGSIMIPWVVFYQQTEYRTDLQLLYICYQEWPRPEQAREFFLGAVFLFCYLFPLLLIVICYSLIAFKVWNRDIGGIFSRNVVIHRAKIRVAKMLVIVVLLFALSWMPLYAINLKLFFDQPLSPGDGMIIQDLIIPMAQWLGVSNCCMNPLVYCFFSKRMRARVRIMLTCSSLIKTRRSLWKRYYSSTKHMTVDYSNGQIKLAFKRAQAQAQACAGDRFSSSTPTAVERHHMYHL